MTSGHIFCFVACVITHMNRFFRIFELFDYNRFKNLLKTRARIYQDSQSAILVLSAEISWNLLLLSNLSIKASYQTS